MSGKFEPVQAVIGDQGPELIVPIELLREWLESKRLRDERQ